MTAHWKDVRCACIPARDLPVLAELRGRAEIRVMITGERAWVWWGPESSLQEEILVRRILPLSGVELFTQRGGRWYRLAEHMPAFDVPKWDVSTGIPLERLIVPAPVGSEPPGPLLVDPLQIRLVRDERGVAQPATALRCALSSLRKWADGATSAQLAPLEAAWTRGDSCDQSDRGANPEVLVLGPPGTVPLLPDGVRFWGRDLLIPLGFRAAPDLPETAHLGALGAGSGELAVVDEDGVELIARGAFERLSRAAIRLACASIQGVGRPEGN
jgi:hypothetical protein